MTIGERILFYRSRHNLSQKRMAKLLGVGAYVVFRAEAGKGMHKIREIDLVRKMNELESKEREN